MTSKLSTLKSEVLKETIKGISKLENYRSHCNQMLSESDKALSDLDHLLELNQTDAIAMMKVSSKRKKLLQERRYYKDEIEVITEILKECPDIQVTCTKVKKIINTYSSTTQVMNNRKYTPRVLTDFYNELVN